MPPYLLTLSASGNSGEPSSGGMLFACWAILIVLIAMSFVFLRSGKKEYSVAILPLLITPFIYIVSGLISKIMIGVLPYSYFEMRAIITVTAGLFSCLLLGLASRKISGLQSRHIFSGAAPPLLLFLPLFWFQKLFRRQGYSFRQYYFGQMCFTSARFF